MKECKFRSYEELPLFLNADTVSSSCDILIYSMSLREEGFL